MTRWCLIASTVLAALGCATPADPGAAGGVGVVRRAVGEPRDGFPSYGERLVHLLVNRGRADPQTELTTECPAANVPDIACYTPQRPLQWSYELNRSARCHSATQKSCGMSHDSKCTLVTDLGTLYTPGTCNGDPSCACQSGACSCGPGACTGTWTRIGMFGGNGNGENVASSGNPVTAYTMWICEAYDQTTCGFDMGPPTNGHRWNILMGSGPAIGIGIDGYSTQDFGGPAAPSNKIVVGVHYPQSGSTVAFRAHWYDPAGAPTQAMVNVNGTCQPMTKERGVADTNATYLLDAFAVGSACAHYYFVFKDQGDAFVTFPESGSFGINCGADYDAATRPTMDASCSCTPDCAGKQCGPDGCGGNCPPGCGANATCNANTCACTVLACGSSCCAAGQVCYQDACCTADCAGKDCGDDGCGGTCGTCAGSLTCDAAGACGCTGGLTACGTECIDTQSNVAHCGGCDQPCTAPQVCAAGICSDTCPTGSTDCDGSCVDLTSDPAHCGDCASACGADATCVAGFCICPGTLVNCFGGGCTDLATDPHNCGECGRECEGCAEGRCPGDPEDAGVAHSTGELQGACGCAGGGPGARPGAALALLLLLVGAATPRRRRG